jgi:hypothetical protein
MASAAEAAAQGRTPMGADLAEGVDTLSLDQAIVFTRYVRLILPLDGYLFWVKTALFTPSALYNQARFNRVLFNQAPKPPVTTTPPTFVVKGSLHYATETRQEETETYGANRVVFTSEYEVQDLNAIEPGTLWIGEWEGQRFAFSSRGSFYRQADLWHYVGYAIYPDMETQIIDDPGDFDAKNVIVSNSLPAWLALNGYVPPYGFGNPTMPLFPSFLVPANERPPYAAVHVIPESTTAWAAAPTIARNSTHTQLCSDRVKITLWGTRNFNALDFVDCVYQYSNDAGVIGIMNMPVVRDEKRTQAELTTIAMKKSVEFEVSYLQHRINNVARQIIEQVFVNFIIQPLSFPSLDYSKPGNSMYLPGLS